MSLPQVPTRVRAALPASSRRSPARTLHDGVLATLRDLIVHGELPPGERLTERVLCARLQVSRTPLREALKVLAHEGLVELLPNCGARVTRLTAADARHLFEVMAALESHAGRLACVRATELELGELRDALRKMQGHFAQHDLPGYFRWNQVIHEAIVRAARNPALAASHASLNARLRRARYLASQHNEARWATAMREHEEIDHALERRAPETVAALLLGHLRGKCEVVCEQLGA